MPALPIDSDQIVITASRVPEAAQRTPASITILDAERIVRLGEPLLPALLRLTPSAAVATLGPAGLLTEVRIRGAENTHTLLFIDGIRANDPSTGDFARFELLNADLASRIEVVRGPQSALWGSQAIGGVIAINGLDDPAGYAASAEAGSFGLLRTSASWGQRWDQGSLAGAIGWQRARGIDSFDGRGDKDGYRNLSARLRGTVAVTPSISLGAAGIALDGRAEFDGYPPPTFERGDSGDSSRNRLHAARAWASFGDPNSRWSGRVGATALGASNRYFLGGDPLNRTRGTRTSFDAQLAHRVVTGPVAHHLIAAVDIERETFHARDTIYGGFTNQDRDRSHQALTVEWRGQTKGVTADVAVRRDLFNRFRDATSWRASLLAEIGSGFALAGSYAQGIAQPTFFDLYGFFPGNYVGNPSLKPERSTGFEGSIRFRRADFAASLTAYRQRLRDEIVENASFTSTLNADGVSRRRGIEAEIAWQPSRALRLAANYAYLKASEPTGALNEQVRERRRPRHSGAILADGSVGRWTYGASIAHVGERLDRQEVLPFGIVRLDPYWLASARIAYALTPRLELHVRGTNLFNDRYEDSADYRTEGRGIFVGIRLADRRSSP